MTTPAPSLRDRVFASLDHALENGYDNLLWTEPAEVADDLAEYDTDLEGEDTAVLAQLVQDWRLMKGLGL
jgi:hypothetical protein